MEMFFPLQVSITRKLPQINFDYAPMLKTIQYELEKQRVDEIQDIENGLAFRNNFLSFKRGKKHLMRGVTSGKLELINDTSDMMLKYTFNIWKVVVAILFIGGFAFSILQDKYAAGLPFAIVAFAVFYWLIFYIRHFFYLKHIVKQIEKVKGLQTQYINPETRI